MKITVGRKGPHAHYIGRGSPLGNPFIIGRDGDRDEVCDKYQPWFDNKVAEKDPAVMAELRAIWHKANRPEGVTLGCFCAPERCHGYTIKAYLESRTDIC